MKTHYGLSADNPTAKIQQNFQTAKQSVHFLYFYLPIFVVLCRILTMHTTFAYRVQRYGKNGRWARAYLGLFVFGSPLIAGKAPLNAM